MRTSRDEIHTALRETFMELHRETERLREESQRLRQLAQSQRRPVPRDDRLPLRKTRDVAPADEDSCGEQASDRLRFLHEC